jgi:sigma-E factor negative regulatory protein RseA
MNRTTPRAPASPADPRELLSALADGEPDALEGGCSAWRDDAGARAAWHAYHLIGDVLRSDELAAPGARDAAFLAALRTRLAAEPVVLAPVRPRRRRQVWVLPTAAAAGFMAVAGVMVVLRTAPEATAPVLANSVQVPAVQAGIAQVRIQRDPRLDLYLSAHRDALRSGAIAVPGGVPRTIEMSAPVTPVMAPVSR